jgi:hypothetical protein
LEKFSSKEPNLGKFETHQTILKRMTEDATLENFFYL